jgi:hypothetical protein
LSPSERQQREEQQRLAKLEEEKDLSIKNCKGVGAYVPLQNRGEALMWALVVLAIYVTPFLLLGWTINVGMKQYVVDLSDVQSLAGPNRGQKRTVSKGRLTRPQGV